MSDEIIIVGNVLLWIVIPLLMAHIMVNRR